MDSKISPRLIGEHPLAKEPIGELVSRVATAFPYARTIVTIPGIHATQRIAFLEIVNREREADGRPAMSEYEQNLHWENSVDLVMEGDTVLIRPDPDKMDLAFDADDLLQEIVPKHKIRFMHVINDKVRNAIKSRGENWRINPLPQGTEEMGRMILNSRIGIGGENIYYYNSGTGTRVLTCGQLARLMAFDEANLRVHLSEIQDFSGRKNRHGHPEISFFKANGFSSANFIPYDFYSLSSVELREACAQLLKQFCMTVPPEYTEDEVENPDWRREMFASLIGREEQAVPEEVLLGMSSEFYMQIEWLPGGRFENGELIFDPVFEDQGRDEELARICDAKVKGFLFNFMREFGDMIYVNIGRVPQSLSKRPAATGRRDVYIAELMLKGEKREVVRIIRMVKWGIREHLQDQKDLLEAIMEAEEYIEYILDRRLGCRQLGMNLPARIVARKITEDCEGHQQLLRGRPIWATYIERDYIHGIATDKMPAGKFANPDFAMNFAALLGKAAAINLVVGRSDLEGNVVFDDGDEVIITSALGIPEELVIADPTGTFNDYLTPLAVLVKSYAKPVNSRGKLVPDPTAFAARYIEAFGTEFNRIQQEYRKRKRGFDSLFHHRRCDPAGSYAFRWMKVLERLNATDPHDVMNTLGINIRFARQI